LKAEPEPDRKNYAVLRKGLCRLQSSEAGWLAQVFNKVSSYEVFKGRFSCGYQNYSKLVFIEIMMQDYAKILKLRGLSNG
jgi:hypothetical protein